jgi:hypothetical protein
MMASKMDGAPAPRCRRRPRRWPLRGLGGKRRVAGAPVEWLTAFVLGVVLLVWPVRAQTIVINPDVDRAGAERDSSHEPFDISYADCVGDNDLVFTVTDLSAGDTLSVWVTDSADCTDRQSRNDGLCTSVIDEFQLSDVSVEITVSAAAVANSFDSVDGCVDTGAVDSPRPAKLYFIVNVSEDPVTGFEVWEQTDVNLLGPPPPTDVTVAPADDTKLTVNYSADDSSTDFEGFYFYCEVTTANAGTGGASTAGTAFGNGGTSASLAAAGFGGGFGGFALGGGGQAVGGGGGGVAGSGGAPGAAGTGGTTGTGGGASGDCTAPTLRAGEPPPAGFARCGETTSETSGIAANLQLGAYYAVAVAGYDLVGNVGDLSELACGTPEPVDDFFEIYRKSGGEAGGGFCGHCGLIGAGRYRNWAAVCMIALGLGFAWRRRSRHDGRPS